MAADLEYLSEMERYNSAIGSHARAGKIRDAIAEISALRAAQVGAGDGAGMVLVPSEPTIEMLSEAERVEDQVRDDLDNYVSGETIDWDTFMKHRAIYMAMLAAAPRSSQHVGARVGAGDDLPEPTA